MKNIKIEYTTKQKELIKEYLKKYKNEDFVTKNNIFNKNFNLAIMPFKKDFKIKVKELDIVITIPKETLKLALYLEETKDNFFIDKLINRDKRNKKFKNLLKLWTYKDLPLKIKQEINKKINPEEINKKIEELTKEHNEIIKKIDQKVFEKYFGKIKGNKSLYTLYEELKNKKRVNTKEKEFMQGINNAIKNIEEIQKKFYPEKYKLRQQLKESIEKLTKEINKIQKSLKNVKTEKTKKAKIEQINQLEEKLYSIQEKYEKSTNELIKDIGRKNYKTYEILYPSYVKNLYKETLYHVGNTSFYYDKLLVLQEHPRRNKKEIEETKKEIKRIEEKNEETRKKYADRLKQIIKDKNIDYKKLDNKNGLEKGIMLKEIYVSYLPEDYDTDYGIRYIEYPSVSFKNNKFNISINKYEGYIPKAWGISVNTTFDLILSNLMESKLKQNFKKEINKNKTLQKKAQEIENLINKRKALNSLRFLIAEIGRNLRETKKLIVSGLENKNPNKKNKIDYDINFGIN